MAITDPPDETRTDAGAVYVFARENNDGVWSQRAYVKAPNTDSGDDCGGTFLAMSADGSTLAVVATNESGGATGIGADQSDNTAPGAGAVYPY